MNEISKRLVKDFVSVTTDTARTDTTVYGTVVENNGVMCVRIDGSDEITPIVSTTTVKENERVRVQIKNHQAVVTGNTTNPAIGVMEENGLRSAIEQSINMIRLEVEDEINDLHSSLEITTQSITSVVEAQENFSKFQQTVEGFSFMGAGGTVKISGGDINLTGSITWSDLAADAQGEVTDAQTTANSAATVANNAYNLADDAYDQAELAETTAIQIANGTYKGGTFISGKKLYSPSLYGDTINLLDGSSNLVGAITLKKTTTFAFDITSQMSIRLNAASGYNSYIGTSGGPFLQLSNGHCVLGGGALVLGQDCYGDTLPTDPVEGQVYFLLAK